MAVDANTAYYIGLTSKFTRRCSKIPIFRRFYYSRNVQYPLSCRMFVFLYVFEMHTGPYSAVLGCFVYSWEWSHYSLDSCWLWIVFAVSLLTFIINDEVVILLTVHSRVELHWMHTDELSPLLRLTINQHSVFRSIARVAYTKWTVSHCTLRCSIDSRVNVLSSVLFSSAQFIAIFPLCCLVTNSFSSAVLDRRLHATSLTLCPVLLFRHLEFSVLTHNTLYLW